MNTGGEIKPHYDTSIDGFINYKCNISVESEDYKLYLEDSDIPVSEMDLYCFEASLYKHWVKPFSRKRILLSYGFLLRYETLGRSGDDSRVKLSKRIIKKFQK
jgi:hypothetical protein